MVIITYKNTKKRGENEEKNCLNKYYFPDNFFS